MTIVKGHLIKTSDCVGLITTNYPEWLQYAYPNCYFSGGGTTAKNFTFQQFNQFLNWIAFICLGGLTARTFTVTYTVPDGHGAQTLTMINQTPPDGTIYTTGTPPDSLNFPEDLTLAPNWWAQYASPVIGDYASGFDACVSNVAAQVAAGIAAANVLALTTMITEFRWTNPAWVAGPQHYYYVAEARVAGRINGT